MNKSKAVSATLVLALAGVAHAGVSGYTELLAGPMGESWTISNTWADSLFVTKIGVFSSLYGPDGQYLPSPSNYVFVSFGEYPVEIDAQTPSGEMDPYTCPAPGSWIARGTHNVWYVTGQDVFYTSS